jgi:hypothetical protein
MAMLGRAEKAILKRAIRHISKYLGEHIPFSSPQQWKVERIKELAVDNSEGYRANLFFKFTIDDMELFVGEFPKDFPLLPCWGKYPKYKVSFWTRGYCPKCQKHLYHMLSHFSWIDMLIQMNASHHTPPLWHIHTEIWGIEWVR